MISTAAFNLLRDFVRRSGVAAEIEELLRPTDSGRPRTLSVETLLTAIIATQGRGTALHLTKVHETLTKELPVSLRRELGITGPGGDLTVRQVRYLFSAIAAVMAAPHGAYGPVRDASDDRAQEWIDRLLEATFPVGGERTGSFAVDGSAIDSPSRPGRDRDARWGHRTKTHQNRFRKVYGYQLVALTEVPAIPGDDGGSLPMLTSRISLVPANGDQIAPTLDALVRLRSCGVPVKEVLSDRGFSFSVPEKWAYPLRALGIDQVLDVHPADHGAKDYDGLLMIDGWPHCPAMPGHLRTIRKPNVLTVSPLPRDATAKDIAKQQRRIARIEAFKEAIADREKWAFSRFSTAPADPKTGKKGSERYQCPAQAGKVQCARCPLSQLLPDAPVVENPPPAATAPRACRQTTVSIPMTVTPKLRQKERWGSPEWVASYRRRSRIEAIFGILKTAGSGNLRRGHIQVRGRVKITLMLTALILSANITAVRRWASETNHVKDELAARPLPEVSFEEVPTIEAPPGG